MITPLVWAALALAALGVGHGAGAPLFSWVGYVMLLTLLTSYALARAGARGLTARRELRVDRIHLGESVEVEVTVENRSALPALWVSAAESLPVGLPMRGSRGRIAPLAGRHSFRFEYTLEGARRGYHEIGPTLLRSGDLFGLYQRQATQAGSAWLTVFPKLVAIGRAPLASRRPLGEVRARQRVLEDPTQIVGIRPYHHGDGMRRVHWRATAHTGKLQSKLFEVTAQPNVTILLNLRRADYPSHPEEAAGTAELAITTAASVARYVLDRGQRVGLLALARDPAGMGVDHLVSVEAARGRDQLTALLSVLGRVELGQTDSLEEVIYRDKQRLAWGTMVVVVTPRLDREVVLALLNLRTAGFGLELILTGRGAAGPDRAGMGMIGISAARVRSEDDIRALDL